MKLVELLVKELEDWPEGVTYFVQDGDREVKAGSGAELSEPTDTGVWIRHISLDNYNFYSCLCADWKTSIVTKDIYTKHKEEIQFPLPTKGHIHAELMAQYAEDAKTTDKPWEFWQVKGRDDTWYRCQDHPKWGCATEYRHKPKTHIVHGVGIPDLRVSLESGASFFLANPTSPELTTLYQFDGDIKDKIWVERGLTYQPTEEGKQAAILHSKAMLGVL